MEVKIHPIPRPAIEKVDILGLTEQEASIIKALVGKTSGKNFHLNSLEYNLLHGLYRELNKNIPDNYTLVCGALGVGLELRLK